MKNKYDLVICGGGFAGVSAAIAASREGMNVLIIEKLGFFGGMATSALVNPFMKYFDRDDRSLIINRGIFREILSNLSVMGGLHENKVTFNEEILKIVLDNMIRKWKIDTLFYTSVISVKMNGKNIESVVVANTEGVSEINAPYFIDATGNADVSFLCGCKYEIGRDQDGACQPMTLCFRIADIDETVVNFGAMQRLYKDFQKSGKIKNKRENILIFKHMAKGVIHFNTTRIIGKNVFCAESLTEAEFEARDQMYEMYAFLKNNVHGFENSTLLMSGGQTGIRESRRIMGEYKLTKDDILGTVKFDDAIACGNYDIDIHNPSGTGTEIYQIPSGDWYTIPYRCLVPLDVENLLVAGRPISSTHEAHSAYRVMPICSNIGEAAGIAASVAFRSGTSFRKADVSKIRAQILKHGGKC